MSRAIALLLAVVTGALAASPASAQLAPGGNHGGGGTGNKPGWVLTPGWLTLDQSDVAGDAPEIVFRGLNGEWFAGPDVANHGGGGRDFVPVGQIKTASDGSRRIEDIVYVTPNDHGARVGVGITPPSLAYRLQTGGQGPEGGLSITRHEGNWGNPFAVVDSNGKERLWVDPEYGLHVPRIFVGGTRMDPGSVASNRTAAPLTDAERDALMRRVAANRSRAVRAERRLSRLEAMVRRLARR